MDKSRPIILKYVCGSESSESAAKAATESAAESAEVAAHHHEVTAAEAAHAHLANLAALGEYKECGINILGNEILCSLACG